MVGTMEQALSEKREISSEKSEMSNFASELDFCSHAMRNVIAPPGTAGSKGERLRRAQQALRWSYSRARDVWYGDARVSIKPHELRRIEEVSGVKYGREEIRTNDKLIERADALLAGADPHFRSPFLAAIRALISAVDRPGTQGD